MIHKSTLFKDYLKSLNITAYTMKDFSNNVSKTTPRWPSIIHLPMDDEKRK